MTSPVYIVDCAVVTAFGDGLAALWDGLMAGRTAIATVDRFTTERYVTEYAACVPELEAPAGSSRVVPLVTRALEQIAPVPEDSHLLTATTKAGIDTLERLCRERPANTQEVLPTTFMDHVRRRTGVQGRGMNVNAACASSTIALARGAAMIAHGRTAAVLVCCADLVSEFVFSGFSALQALSSSPAQPFDRGRSGLTLGEGAAALVLMSPERARATGRSPLAVLAGWGTANDANHVTAPARDGCGLIQATTRALAVAGRQPADIAAINAHGTATVYNDLMELKAFRTVFGAQRPPMNSIKGAIGHSLGAAGGIEAALAVRLLQEQCLPPTVGYAEPENGAGDCVSARPQTFSGDHVLTTNSGFGGINCALVISRAEGV